MYVTFPYRLYLLQINLLLQILFLQILCKFLNAFLFLSQFDRRELNLLDNES